PVGAVEGALPRLAIGLVGVRPQPDERAGVGVDAGELTLAATCLVAAGGLVEEGDPRGEAVGLDPVATELGDHGGCLQCGAPDWSIAGSGCGNNRPTRVRQPAIDGWDVAADDPLVDDDKINAREAARNRRRDRDAAAEARALMRPGMGKVFKQIQDVQRRVADDEAPAPAPPRK